MEETVEVLAGKVTHLDFLRINLSSILLKFLKQLSIVIKRACAIEI